MKHHIHCAVTSWLFITLLLIANLATCPAMVKAQTESEKLRSILIIEPPEPQPVGSRITVNVNLANDNGTGVPNKPLILYVNGKRVRRIRTDENGAAQISIGRDWPVGEYALRVVFNGTEAYLRSSDNSTFTVRPVNVVITTIPPLPGTRFLLEDQTFVSQDDGQVQIELTQPGTYHLKALLPEIDTSQTDTRIDFERWGDSVFTPEREVNVRKDTSLQAGFVLSHPVSQTFVDLNGDPVSEARISTLTLKSSYGSVHTFEDGQAHWLQANRIARRKNGLEVAPAQYSVESVIIDGANVVNKYQQRFFVTPNANWELELLLYYADVQAKDAIFGFPLGNGVSLEYPDGRAESRPFGSDRRIRIGPLARGNYKLQVTGAYGIAPPTPVALSRDQNVELKVLSVLDIGLGMILGASLGFGLLFYGRPQLVMIPIEVVAGFLFKPGVSKPGIPVKESNSVSQPTSSAQTTAAAGTAIDAELPG